MAAAPDTTNVVRLPTAAPRKVQQRSIRAMRRARGEAPWPWVYKPTHVRDAERLVEDCQRSPELLIALSIFAVLTAAQKKEVRATVDKAQFFVGDAESLSASRLLARIG